MSDLVKSHLSTCTRLYICMLFFDINLYIRIYIHICILYHIYSSICTICTSKTGSGILCELKPRIDRPGSCEVILFSLRSCYSLLFMMIMGFQIKTGDFYTLQIFTKQLILVKFRMQLCNELLVRILFPLQKAAWHSTMQDVLLGPYDAEIRKKESRVMMNALSTW